MSHIFKATHTQASIASKIVNFITNPSPFVCIGKPTSWQDPYSDEYIPDPNLDSTVIDPIAYVKPRYMYAVYKSPCGELYLNSTYWSKVELENIHIRDSKYSPNVTHVYVGVDVTPDHYYSDSFRVIGLYTHTTLIKEANPNLISYEPSFIDNPGILHWIAYSTPIHRLENKSHKLDLLISL